MPDAGILATVLLVVGLFLLGLEFFIPSFGMIGILAGISLVISFWSATKAWGNGENPAFFWTYVCLLTAGIPGTVFGSFYAIQYTSLGKSIVLQPPTVVVTSNPLELLIGKKGLAQTLLTPGGMVLVDRERYHAESTGMLIDPNTPVVVTGVNGNRLVVRPSTVEEQRAAVVSDVAHDGTNSLSAVGSGEEKVIVIPVSVHEKPVSVEPVAAIRPLPASQTPESPSDSGLDFDIPEDFKT